MKQMLMTAVAGWVLLAAVGAAAQPGARLMSLDADGDGQLSREEFSARPGGRGPELFEGADSDGDGAVTREELQAALDAAAERRGRGGALMLQRFDTIDADGDGRITREEAEAHAFSRMDADGDGFISADEVSAMQDQRRGWQGRRGESP